jgi:hypothetical protein
MNGRSLFVDFSWGSDRFVVREMMGRSLIVDFWLGAIAL